MQAIAALHSTRESIPILLEQGRLSEVVQSCFDVTSRVLLQHEDRMNRHHKLLRCLWDHFEHHEEHMCEAVHNAAERVESAVSMKFEEVQLVFERAAHKKAAENARTNRNTSEGESSHHASSATDGTVLFADDLAEVTPYEASRGDAQDVEQLAANKAGAQAKTKTARAKNMTQVAGQQSSAGSTAGTIDAQDVEKHVANKAGAQAKTKKARVKNMTPQLPGAEQLSAGKRTAETIVTRKTAASATFEAESDHDNSTQHLAFTGGSWETMRLLPAKGTSDLEVDEQPNRPHHQSTDATAPSFSGRWKLTAVRGDMDALLAELGHDWMARKKLAKWGYGVNSFELSISPQCDVITYVHHDTPPFQFTLNGAPQEGLAWDGSGVIVIPAWDGEDIIMECLSRDGKKMLTKKLGLHSNSTLCQTEETPGGCTARLIYTRQLQ